MRLNMNGHLRYRIGCITTPKDFVVAGTATDKLYGVAEGLWEPDLVSLGFFGPRLFSSAE